MKTLLVMYRTIFIYIVLLFAFSQTASANENLIRLTTNDGLSSSSVTSLCQDSRGLLWIGTWDGLNRYDGGGFKVYASVTNNSSTLSHPVVREICEEDSLHLWVATDGGLNRLDNTTLYQLTDHEWFIKLSRHILRQTTFVHFQLRTNDDYRTS